MVTVTKVRGVVIKKPSGDKAFWEAFWVILGSQPQAMVRRRKLGVSSLSALRLVTMESLFGNLFQFGQTSPVLDVGLDPLIDFSLGGFRWCVVFQYWSLGPDNVGMKRISRSGRSRGRLFGFRG